MKQIILAVGLCGWSPAWGGGLPLTLNLNPGGKFDLHYSLSSGPTAVSVLNLSGSLAGELEWNRTVVRFRFSGGKIVYSDSSADMILSSFPVSSRFRLLTRGVAARPLSDTAAGGIDPLSGLLQNTGHFLRQDQGTVTLRYLIGGTVIQEDVRDLAAQPDQSALVGISTVVPHLLDNLGYAARYRIEFTHSRDLSREEPALEVGGTLTVRETGGFSAQGNVWVPGADFVNWAESTSGTTPSAVDHADESSGIPLLLWYAFQLPPSQGRSLPVWIRNESSGKIAVVELPAAGLAAPVRLEFSPDLKEGNWTTLTGDGGMVSQFETGAAGPRSFALPLQDRGFVRLVCGVF